MKFSTYKSTPFFIFIVAVSLIVASHSFAQEPVVTTGTTSDDSIQLLPERSIQGNEGRVADRVEVRKERRVTLQAKFQERIVNLSSNVIKRLSAGTERMSNIATRLETRIAKEKVLGVDTTNAEAKLAEAKSSIEKTREIITNLQSVQAAMSSDRPRETFIPIRMQFAAARITLMTSHALLRETISILKNAAAMGTLNQSTTTTTTIDTPVSSQ